METKSSIFGNCAVCGRIVTDSQNYDGYENGDIIHGVGTWDNVCHDFIHSYRQLQAAGFEDEEEAEVYFGLLDDAMTKMSRQITPGKLTEKYATALAITGLAHELHRRRVAKKQAVA